VYLPKGRTSALSKRIHIRSFDTVGHESRFATANENRTRVVILI
jgi:hypothetical protein